MNHFYIPRAPLCSRFSRHPQSTDEETKSFLGSDPQVLLPLVFFPLGHSFMDAL